MAAVARRPSRYASRNALDARIRGTKPAAQQLILLVIISQQRAGNLAPGRIGRALAGRLPKRSQFQIDVSDKFRVVGAFPLSLLPLKRLARRIWFAVFIE